MSDTALRDLDGDTARAILTRCDGCNLDNEDLSGKDLHGVRLDGANMRGVDLRHANLSDARFDGSNLEDVRFQGASMQTARFDGANLRGADLHGMDLNSTHFDGANLEEANLSGANLHNASVMGSNFRRANLRNADLENAAVCINDTEKYDGNRVVGRLECARFDGADLHGVNLRHVRRCVWTDRDQQQCSPATVEMLRDAGHADLSGAITP